MADTTEQPKVEEAATKVDEPTPVAVEEKEEGVATTGEEEQDDDIKSKKVTLADLSAKGTALYAHKNYEAAAEFFSHASVLQAEINGETAPENAEILFHYGRSLFRVGQSKSDVLGGSAPQTEKKAPAKPKPSKPTEADKPKEEGAASSAAATSEKKDETSGKDATANKPLFQFTGDENFDDSDDEQVR